MAEKVPSTYDLRNDPSICEDNPMSIGGFNEEEPLSALDAKEGVHYRTVRVSQRLKHQCQLPGCPKLEKNFTSLDDLGVHMLHEHKDPYRARLPHCAGVRKRCREDEKCTGPKKIIKQNKSFACEWLDCLNKKLDAIRKTTVLQSMNDIISINDGGIAKSPGPLPHLLTAIETVGKGFVQPWDALSNQYYTSWLKFKVREIMHGPRTTYAFATDLESCIQRHAGCDNGCEHSCDNECANIPALKTVKGAIHSVDTGPIVGTHNPQICSASSREELIDEAKEYLDNAHTWYWSKSFFSDPAETVQKSVEFEFHEWRHNELSGKKKKQEVFREWQRKCNPQGSRPDVINDVSDEEEAMRPSYRPVNIHEEVHNFKRLSLSRGGKTLRRIEVLRKTRDLPLHVKVRSRNESHTESWDSRFTEWTNKPRGKADGAGLANSEKRETLLCINHSIPDDREVDVFREDEVKLENEMGVADDSNPGAEAEYAKEFERRPMMWK